MRDKPIRILLVIFTLWKALLLCIALTSPGPGYDTSTTFLDNHDLPSANLQRENGPDLLSRKFVRWDAIYYTQIAIRGYKFEQEWAFGWGFTNLLSLISVGNETSWHLKSSA